jgi:hypothetical protein
MSKQPFKQMSNPLSTTQQQMYYGGSAFPYADTIYPNGQIQCGANGMSLLDWFAGMAMQGILSNPIVRDPDTDTVAQDAYEVAKSMLAAKKGGSHE